MNEPDEASSNDNKVSAEPSGLEQPSKMDEGSPQTNADTEAKAGSSWKLGLAVLCAMLVLALAGMGFTQASETGAWEYWLFVVVLYAALGMWRSSRNAKQAGQSIRKSIFRELSHWGTLIVFLAVLLLLERRDIVNRDSASYLALMLLALSCCMAGVHIDWLLLFVGVVLTIMLVAMATLKQFSVMLWIVMIFVAFLAAVLFYFRAKRGGASGETSE